jgi:hypothetical protein
MGLLYEKLRSGVEQEMPQIKEASVTTRTPVRATLQLEDDWDFEVGVLEDDNDVTGILADELDTEDYEDELV